MRNDRDLGEISRDDEGRGFHVRGVVFHTKTWVRVGNDATDNGEGADVEQQHSPKGLSAGAR
jgi:hypothetical protein